MNRAVVRRYLSSPAQQMRSAAQQWDVQQYKQRAAAQRRRALAKNIMAFVLVSLFWLVVHSAANAITGG